MDMYPKSIQHAQLISDLHEKNQHIHPTVIRPRANSCWMITDGECRMAVAKKLFYNRNNMIFSIRYSMWYFERWSALKTNLIDFDQILLV